MIRAGHVPVGTGRDRPGSTCWKGLRRSARPASIQDVRPAGRGARTLGGGRGLGKSQGMRPDFAEPSVAGNPADRQRPAAAPSEPTVDWRALRLADRACCCPAKPVVVAVMPPSPGRDHATDLLLCGHHYRTFCLGLLAAGATVYDAAGRTVVPPPRVLLGAS